MPETPLLCTPLLREHVVGGATVVALYGEIDILTAPPISARLDVLTAGPQPELVLDLRTVAFMDCRGLALLCRARNRVQTRGGRIRLVVDNPHVLRLLRRAELGQAFDLYPSLLGALPAVPGRTSRSGAGAAPPAG
ncbi:STAS domain-containing protein [Streptomyces sp. E11-3]|uniref:STAS domain-containing protein n=1 Tax=Streptomyces sp. E11-3 TaxID=3110112 RepID=UPI00397EFDCE